MTPLNFLHIGKCAGNQIINLFSQVDTQSVGYKFIAHGHLTRLSDLPAGEPFFFSIRDPIERFVSGFYSRKRCGAPKNNISWSPAEASAFQHFEHADDLARVLSEESKQGSLARRALQSIYHTSQSQADWFERQGFFLELTPPVWVVRVEYFTLDLNTLCQRLGFQDLNVPSLISNDPLKSHAAPPSHRPILSDTAKANLEAWYLRDFWFYRDVEHWMCSQSVLVLSPGDRAVERSTN